MIGSRSPWTTLVALAAVAACGGDDGRHGLPPAAVLSETDSAGVRIVTSSGGALTARLPWVVDTVPDLELGAVEGDASFQFHMIRGITGLSDGGFVVVDGGSRELRWFAASGEHVRTVGGSGQGPGEFMDPLLVPRFMADSLLIFDRMRRAFTWMAADGSGVRSLGPGGPAFIGTPTASAGERALFGSVSGSTSCPENAPCELPLALRWVDVAGAAVDTLIIHTIRMLRYTQSGPPVLVTGPLDQKNVGAAGPAGPVLPGDPRFELRQFDAYGRLVSIFRVDAPPRMTPDDALDEYVQRAPDPGELRGVYELMGLPETVPAFQSVRVDHLGWYWAELFRPGEGATAEWLVFDPDGRARGVVELPAGFEVHDVGEAYILGTWTNDLDVESVRRYPLERRGS